MDPAKEEAIRAELQREPPTRRNVLKQKYKVGTDTITQIRRQLKMEQQGHLAKLTEKEKEEAIRLELQRVPSPSRKELMAKYQVSAWTVTQIRKDIGIKWRSSSRSEATRERIRAEIQRNPSATNKAIANQLGLGLSTVEQHRRIIKATNHQPTESKVFKPTESKVEQNIDADTPQWNYPLPARRKAPPRPRDPVRLTQWMWREAKELRIQLRYALRQMDSMDARLDEIADTIDHLLPFEIWERYYIEGTPGYGALPTFLAERAGLDLEPLIERLSAAAERYHHLLRFLTASPNGTQMNKEAYTNGTSADIPN